jgi:hypothetical protein
MTFDSSSLRPQLPSSTAGPASVWDGVALQTVAAVNTLTDFWRMNSTRTLQIRQPHQARDWVRRFRSAAS